MGFIDFHNKYADKQILFDSNKILRWCNKILIIGCILCDVSLMSYPIIDSVFLSKKKVLGFGVLLPFTNPEENIGFFLNFLLHNMEMIAITYGFVAFQRMYFIFFSHACVRIDILKNTVDDLKKYVTDKDDAKQNQLLSLKLNEIVQLHLEYLRFNNLFLFYLREFFRIFNFRFIDILETVGKKIIFVLAFTTIISVSLILLLLSTAV